MINALSKQLKGSIFFNPLKRAFGEYDLPNNIKGLKCEEVGRDIHITPQNGYKNSLIWMHGLGDSPLGFLDLFYSKQSPVPLLVYI